MERDRRTLLAARERADLVRAVLMYDRWRGIATRDSFEWMCLGWDTGNMCDELRHPSEAVAKLFNVPKWRPTEEELTWFRAGFAYQRAGKPRPVIRG